MNGNIDKAFDIALASLLRARNDEGFWEGRLSSSALSTATAVSALSIAKLPEDEPLIRQGVAWLAKTQLADGGWGDTPDSPSNAATTLLATSALTLAGEESGGTCTRALAYINEKVGATPSARVRGITKIYGADRTFAVPILINCALAGLVNWEDIPDLPFELAVFPHGLLRALRLHVVSYALPALIAIGILLHSHRPRNFLRGLVKGAALRKLAAIQPSHGGFLEATPLTAFVGMSLLSLLGPDYPVARKCLHFLRQSIREDGSWPIDTNLSVWVTTSSVQALQAAGKLDSIDAGQTRDWLLSRQFGEIHPFTNAQPGGWGWSHLPGAVPDGDDTSGALLALTALGDEGASASGIAWLLQLQNRDGGWPTFCRGWGQLPFDRSSPDITAHALRALHADASRNQSKPPLPDSSGGLGVRAISRGIKYLRDTQRADGAWVPLWFGNQQAPQQHNPVLGTARVLMACGVICPFDEAAQRGIAFLISAQNPDGGWGGAADVPSTIEETALAISALCPWRNQPAVEITLQRAGEYLANRILDGHWPSPTPLGLYFASLWYSEDLYPVIWTVEALGKLREEPSTISASLVHAVRERDAELLRELR